jgi:uncharacterized protein YeaO (DUF488 family)
MLKIKRVYDKPERADGERILVDRLWPRGLSKRAAAIDEWMKELAPSHELRKWFGHDPARWREFRRRYLTELRRQRETLAAIARKAKHQTVTLLFGARHGAQQCGGPEGGARPPRAADEGDATAGRIVHPTGRWHCWRDGAASTP